MKPNQYIRFKRSKPWGYLPSEVEKAIDEYEATIGKLNDKLMEMNQIALRYKERCTQLEDELRAMHIEMSALELPDTEEMVESVVLSDFRNYPNGPQMPMSFNAPPDEDGVVEIPAGENMHNEAFNMVGEYDEDDSVQIQSMLNGTEDDDEEEAPVALPPEPKMQKSLHLNSTVKKQAEEKPNTNDDNDDFCIVT